MRVSFAAFVATTSVVSLNLVQTDAQESRPCNEIISVATVAELRQMAEVFAQSFEVSGATTDSEDIASAVEVLTAPIMFDVVVSKVCSSCGEAFPVDPVPESCAEGIYGSKATYSALAFHPLNEDGRVLNGELNGEMSFLSTRLDFDFAPTIIYPENITQLLEDNGNVYAGNNNSLPVSLFDVYNSLMTASSGGIGMIFDNLGTGESLEGFDRSWGIKHPVQQGTVVTWKAVQDYTSQVSNGCTTLVDRAILYGYSLGAHHAMWGSVALLELGVEIVQSFIQAGPFDLEGLSAFNYLGQSLGELTLDPTTALFTTAFAVSYSNSDATYLPNAGTDQFYISEEWMNASDVSRNVPEWWFGDELKPKDLLGFVQPTEVLLDMYNPEIARINAESMTNGGRPCDSEFITADVEFLCQALRENADVYPLMFETTFPIQTCHSPNDEVVPFFTTEIIPDNQLISSYEAPFSFMEPNSNHVNSQVACWAAMNVWMADNPEYFSEVVEIEEGIDGRNCSAPLELTPSASPGSIVPTGPVVVDGTSSPTASPTSSATRTPTVSEVDTPSPTPTAPTSGGAVPFKTSFGMSVLLLAISWAMTALLYY